MKNLKYLIVLLPVIIFVACEENGPPTNNGPVAEILKSDGVFILNEGNYLAGNGSLSYYSYDSSKIFNDIFYQANNRPLGDVANSMVITGDKALIAVNNSGKIEVVDKNNLEVIKTIENLVSPRNILIISPAKAYVSSLYSNSLAILDLQTNSLAGSINIRRSSEAMVLLGAKAYVSSWYSGKDIMVINVSDDRVIDSIEVAPEPESMVLDKNNKLWVLCNGGYLRQNFAELIVVNTTTDEILKRFVFPSKLMSPSCLQINGTRDTVYYVENGIWRMGIESSALPASPFKTAAGRLIYKIGIDPVENRIFFTDALDYQQKGFVLQLTRRGTMIDSCKADIIPGNFCFK